MNSIKTFWSPELKKERALRKDEATKMAVWKEQYRVVQEETQVGKRRLCVQLCMCFYTTVSSCKYFWTVFARGHIQIILWTVLVDFSRCCKAALKTGKQMKRAAWLGTPSCLLVQKPSGWDWDTATLAGGWNIMQEMHSHTLAVTRCLSVSYFTCCHR